MPVKNTLVDLHNMLMEQIERLNDDELSDDDLDKEVKRTDSMVKIGKVICDNSANMIAAQKIVADAGGYVPPQRILIGDNED